MIWRFCQWLLMKQLRWKNLTSYRLCGSHREDCASAGAGAIEAELTLFWLCNRATLEHFPLCNNTRGISWWFLMLPTNTQISTACSPLQFPPKSFLLPINISPISASPFSMAIFSYGRQILGHSTKVSQEFIHVHVNADTETFKNIHS